MFCENNIYYIFNEWLDYLSNLKNFSNNTVIAYSNDIKEFNTFFQNYVGESIQITHYNNLQIKDLRAWISYRNNKNYDNNSNLRALSSLKNFLKFLQAKELIDNSKIFSFRLRKKQNLLPKYIEEDEVKQFIKLLNDGEEEEWVVTRDYTVILLLYGAGLRISEALNLRIKDIDLNSNIISVIGKGNKNRIVPIINTVKQSIDYYLKILPYKITSQEDYVFLGEKGKQLRAQIINLKIRNIRSILSNNNATAHSFRHSFATHLINNGADIRSIQELLGHQSLSTTQIYTKLNSKKLLDTYNKTHPFA